MVKRIFFSAKLDHDVIKEMIPILKKRLNQFNLIFHDPTKQFFDLEELPKQLGDIDFFIIKVASECSIDLLHFAKIHDIPALHDVDTVLMCKNKIALDQALRKVLEKHSNEVEGFYLPKSWTHNLMDIEKFKDWAVTKFPIVLKSHYQHDKYNRFNFLANDLKDIDKFCKIYSDFLYYDVYIQEFIECDGFERKFYVIGDKIFGIKRENPIYLYLREKPEHIDVTTIQRETLEVSDEISQFARIISNELKLKIFGFDLVKPLHGDGYFLIDVNDFPGLRGINNIEHILVDFIEDLLKEQSYLGD